MKLIEMWNETQDELLKRKLKSTTYKYPSYDEFMDFLKTTSSNNIDLNKEILQFISKIKESTPEEFDTSLNKLVKQIQLQTTIISDPLPEKVTYKVIWHSPDELNKKM